MKKTVNPNIINELKNIQQKNGLLRAQDVVEAARNESSSLHSYFEWDDSIAAENYRVEQARGLIQTVYVKFDIPDGTQKEVRAYVSLSEDRINGGYRDMAVVMKDENFRERLLGDALSELKSFERKYQELVELSSIFKSIKEVTENLVVA